MVDLGQEIHYIIMGDSRLLMLKVTMELKIVQ